jgi:hypothetical protein
MKPTHVKGHLEDTLYIPLITETYRWNDRNKNVFGLTNFTYNSQLFKALISFMKEPSSGWHTATPSNDPLGRPFWLFDWHDGKAYAWFPDEDNYNYDDSNLAFIVGVPCTPLLSTRDEDIPQQFPQNTMPNYLDVDSLKRAIPKRCRSNIDVRQVEKETRIVTRRMDVSVVRQVPLLIEGASSGAESGEIEQRLAMTQQTPQSRTETFIESRPIKYSLYLFKIIDYMYYACVLRKVEINMRAAALKVLTYKK